MGYGAWGIGKTGWVGAQDDESLRALHRAIAAADGKGLPADQVERLKAHRWVRNCYR